jgi:NCS1 family nucleobase:cation symporter-1
MLIMLIDPVLGQVFGFPVSNFITTLFGMVVAASSQKVYGTIIWFVHDPSSR